MIASLEHLDVLLDAMFGAGQGRGAKGVIYNFAGGKAGIMKAAAAAKKSGLTVGQELAKMVHDTNVKAGEARASWCFCPLHFLTQGSARAAASPLRRNATRYGRVWAAARLGC